MLFREQTTITLLAPAGGVVARAPVVFGNVVVVPQDTVAAGEPYTAGMPGCARYDNAAKAMNEAWVAGDRLYWDAANGEWTKAAAGNTLGALARVPADAADSLGSVIIAIGVRA